MIQADLIKGIVPGSAVCFVIDGDRLELMLVVEREARGGAATSMTPRVAVTLSAEKIRQWRIAAGRLQPARPVLRARRPAAAVPVPSPPQPTLQYDPVIETLTGIRVPLGTHRCFLFP